MKKSVQFAGIYVFIMCFPLWASNFSIQKNARKYIKEAIRVNQDDPALSSRLFRLAFNESLKLTLPRQSENVREEGFLLASKCLHPDLFPEVRTAIDTALRLFPNGPNFVDFLIQKALLDFSDGKPFEAQESLRIARDESHGKIQERIDSLRFHGFLTMKHFRSAQELLEAVNESAPNAISERNIRRFKTGSEIVSKATIKVLSNEYDHSAAASALKDVLEYTYFAPVAPKASLLGLRESDQVKPILHGCDVSWMGLTRTMYHRLPPQKRLEKLLEFLVKYPQAPPELLGRAIVEIRGLYLYEFRDEDQANYWLNRLQAIPEWKDRSEVEFLCQQLTNERLDTEEANENIRRLENFSAVLPYDNGRLPVITFEEIRKLRAFSDLLLGKKKDLAISLRTLKFSETEKIRSIPLGLIMLLGAGEKNEAYREFQKVLSTVQSRDKRFLDDFLFPLYSLVSPGEQRIIAAFAVSKRFPIISIDTLLALLTTNESHFHSDHALKLLADLYQENMSYIEAQSAWTTLRKIFPNSVWIQ